MSVSPHRANRPVYTIDTRVKERALQKANRSITKVVMQQRSLVDAHRPGWWVPGVGTVARALRLMRDRKSDTHFQKYVQTYVQYDPLQDGELRQLQATQQQPRPTSAASSWCSFGSGRAEYAAKGNAAHGAAGERRKAGALDQSAADPTQRPSSAAAPRMSVSVHSYASDVTYQLPRSMQSLSVSGADVTSNTSGGDVTSNTSGGSGGVSSAGRQCRPASGAMRPASAMARRSVQVDGTGAVLSQAPFKVWMAPTWDNVTVAAAVAPTASAAGGAAAPPGAAAGGAAAAAREKRSRAALDQPPVVDLRKGGAASAMISAAMQQQQQQQQKLSASMTGTLHGTDSLEQSLAPAPVKLFVPQEYGTTFRAHQHLVFHLPQPAADPLAAVGNQSFAIGSFSSGASFAGLGSTASAASGDCNPQQQQEPHAAETAESEEKRLLANYGYRSPGGNNSRAGLEKLERKQSVTKKSPLA